MSEKTIEELEEEIRELHEEIRKISSKNPEKWQKIFMENGACLDPYYPRSVRVGEHIIYCNRNYVSANVDNSDLGARILETMADIIRRRLNGEDI